MDLRNHILKFVHILKKHFHDGFNYEINSKLVIVMNYTLKHPFNSFGILLQMLKFLETFFMFEIADFIRHFIVSNELFIRI